MDYILSLLSSLTQEALAPTTAAFALAAIGLNVHFGLTGLVNMGQAAFLLLGAYGFAISITNGLPFVMAVLVALLVAIVFAIILGIPTLRLRGDYLAIVTISAPRSSAWWGARACSPRRPAARTASPGRATATRSTPSARSRRHHLHPVVHVLEQRRQRLVDPHRGVGPRRPLHPRAVPAHAQPLGPCREGHPRGRGRRPLPRQERLLVQDAGARLRRCARSPGRHHLRPAELGAARRDGPFDDVLHLDGTHPRRRGDGVRTGPRRGAVLRRPARDPHPRRRLHPELDHERAAGRAVLLRARRSRSCSSSCSVHRACWATRRS